MSPFYDSHNGRAGYDVEYKGGDKCLADERVQYKSHVRYLCDVDGHGKINDFPQLVTEPDYDPSTQCTFNFVWHSRFACSACRLDQVKMHEGMCNAQNGEAPVHITKKKGEQCVLDFIPDSYMANFAQSGMLKMDEKKM